MTTNTATFSIDDVELLYSVPKPGADLAMIVRVFMSINRCAPRPFSDVRECFTKALKTGILLASDGRYRIAPEWYKRIHEHDESEGNEIESMLAFQDTFVGEEVPVVADVQVGFTKEDYEAVLQSMQG